MQFALSGIVSSDVEFGEADDDDAEGRDDKGTAVPSVNVHRNSARDLTFHLFQLGRPPGRVGEAETGELSTGVITDFFCCPRRRISAGILWRGGGLQAGDRRRRGEQPEVVL